MATITEDFVSFETAKLLKEKNCPDFGYSCICDSEGNKAQTQSIIMKWLREVHHIYTEICLYKTNKDDIEPKKSRKAPYYTFGVWNTVTGDNVDKRLTNDFIGDSYEQACEAAIKYCLENLI